MTTSILIVGFPSSTRHHAGALLDDVALANMPSGGLAVALPNAALEAAGVIARQLVTRGDDAAATAVMLGAYYGASSPATLASATAQASTAVQAAHTHGGTTGSSGSNFTEHEVFSKVEAAATSKGTIASDAASANATQLSHPRTLSVVFPASWDGGDVTVAGIDVGGNAVTETFLGGDGVTRTGTKVFARITATGGITNSVATGAGLLSATVKTGASIGLSQTPVAFVKLTSDGADEAISASSLSEKSFVPTTAPNGTKVFEVWYTCAGDVHTHSIASATPVITVTNPTHTHTLA